VVVSSTDSSWPRQKAFDRLPGNALPRVASTELLGPRGELVIVHNGRDYRLRLTQNGKLILTA